MLDLQEISDRLEIQQLFADYADALDHRDFDRLDDVITEDAHLDYRSVGGIHGLYPEIKVWLSERVPLLGDYFHMVGNFSATFGDDTTIKIGKTADLKETPEPRQAEVVDLMERLRQSLQGAGGARKTKTKTPAAGRKKKTAAHGKRKRAA